MRKTTFLILFLMLLVSNGFAKSRSSSEAQTIANSFCQKSQTSTKRMSSGTTLTLAYTCSDGIATRSSGVNTYYYVFNIGDNNGFIIVSGDDRAKEILGYSDNGSFDANNLPTNFSAWLSFYQKEMKALIEQPETTAVSSTTTTASTRQTSFATSVPPLLGGIKWDQGAPYNNLCPVIDSTTYKRAVTGCVATAMAQVMKYHQWPVRGTGSSTYSPDVIKRPLTVDFSQTAYDWANMTNTYGSSSTQVQKDAVATLMYHAGVAVNMNYGESSSASTLTMGQSLIKYFGYDANIQIYQRDYYTNAEWVSMLKTELNSSRPVLYSGNSTDVGHQFVCDGYDSNSLFHFNWGWSGSSDGYFELSALNPGSLGIGGGTSGGFNMDQSIVIGVQKSGATPTSPTYKLNLDSPLTSSVSSTLRNKTFTISTGGLFNRGINVFNGSIGIALYNDSGFVTLLKGYAITDLKSYYGWSSLDYSGATIPTNVAAGNYKLYSVYQPTGDSNWQIMKGKVGTPNYLNVTVSSSNITFSTPDVMPKLTLNSMTVTGNLYQSKTGRITVSLTNNGGEYNSMLALQLKSTTNSTTTQIISKNPINIPTGETKSFYIEGDITMTPGQYYLSTMYDPANDRDNAVTFVSVGNALTVNILATPTTAAALTLTSKISFPDASNVSKSNAVLTAHIKNTGGYFDNNVIAFIFPKTGGTSLTYIGYQKIILDTNEERTITFTGNIDIDAGNYFTGLYYWNATGNTWGAFTPTNSSQLAFTLVNDPTTGIEETTQKNLAIYPNPAIDKLYLKSDELVKTIRIINLTGKQVLLMTPEMNGEISIPVNELTAGTYILQSVTETGTKTYKFIKK